MRRHEFAVILCDRDLAASNWREALAKLVATAPGSHVILASRVNDDQLWQEVIRLGGYDVLTKPFQQERVMRSINYAGLTRSRPYGRHTESIPESPSD